ncbi:MAG: TlpA family protein disulfide reductase [Acidobacteriota bacterium]|nr:TlpA family protein disulfide reductase [Acidobacteriota bacterium]
MKLAVLSLVSLALLPAILLAQTSPDPEQTDLSKAISEAGNSGVDYVRALERHLAKYPDSPHRAEIVKALAKAAMEDNDRERIVKYGGQVLDTDASSHDLELFDRVIRGLLDSDDPVTSFRALNYAKRYEAAIDAMRGQAGENHMSEGQWQAEVDKGRARSLVLHARATGNLGNFDEALKLAQQAWNTSPNAEDAREMARWLDRIGRKNEAIEYYANAFIMDDPRTNDNDRARDRQHLREIYVELHNDEKGLGDLILQAYDRTVALKKDRLASMKLKDPNAGATEILDFVLPGATSDAAPLPLASLKGKTVVMDFWATWCGPCKIQHPMIEKIRERYQDNSKVVFVSVDSDSDHALVAPFLKEMKWNGPIYYDGGASRALNISSIPTVIVLDKNGRISSRMIGFIPERFEDMLTERIEETRTH